MTLKRGATGRMPRIAAVAIIGLVVLAGPAAGQQSRVFVTSTHHNGNLGGLAGADMICERLAAAAGLGGGPWVAWLSTSTVDAVDRLLPGSGPFVRAADTATVIADDIPDLIDFSLDNPIQLDETGGPPVVLSWTGTEPAGVAFGDNCADWTSASSTDRGNGGDPTNTGIGWTTFLSNTCDAAQALYCFEAPAPMMPTLPRGGLLMLAVLLVAVGGTLVRRRAQKAR